MTRPEIDKEEQFISQAKAGTWQVGGSVSEIITVALALDRYDLLPKPYTDAESAWQRLNARQQGIVRRHAPSFTPPLV